MPINVKMEWRGDAIFGNLKQRARQELQAIAPEVAEWCQQVHTPIDTSRLRSTVKAEVSRQAIRITISAGGIAFDGYDVDYALWVHDGTDKMAARPFITWTMNDWTPEFMKAVQRAWKSLG
jgi:hypothetical protein